MPAASISLKHLPCPLLLLVQAGPLGSIWTSWEHLYCSGASGPLRSTWTAREHLDRSGASGLLRSILPPVILVSTISLASPMKHKSLTYPAGKTVVQKLPLQPVNWEVCCELHRNYAAVQPSKSITAWRRATYKVRRWGWKGGLAVSPERHASAKCHTPNTTTLYAPVTLSPTQPSSRLVVWSGAPGEALDLRTQDPEIWLQQPHKKPGMMDVQPHCGEPGTGASLRLTG